MASVDAHMEHVKSNPINLWFGNSLMGESDNAMIGFFRSSGVLLFVTYLVTLFDFTARYPVAAIGRKSYRLAILALVVGTFHYPVLFAIPSQMLLGALIAEGMVDRIQRTDPRLGWGVTPDLPS